MTPEQATRVARDVASILCGLGIVAAQALTGQWNALALAMAAVFLGVPAASNLQAFLGGMLSGGNGNGAPATRVSLSRSQPRSRRPSSSSPSSSPSSNGAGDDDE